MADERFNALSTDPRYRLPSRREARTAVDPRFKTLFKDPEFQKKASVDRYGRAPKPGSGKKELERLYRLEKQKKPTKLGRDSVGDERDDSEEGDEDQAEDEELVEKKDVLREGFSESSSDEESTSEEESDEEAELADETAGQEQTEDIPMGEESHRIAAVNLDWDNIRASDILAVAQSFVPSSGRIESVTVYPSEFGRERLEREELEGPPREIFASSSRRSDAQVEKDDISEQDDEDDEDDEKIKRQLMQTQANEGDEFDTAKLRQYQLERLRYYYTVIQCDSKQTAKALYDSMDGREYLSTANFFDLRFIPDDTSFDDDQPRDQCTQLPDSYKPNDFRTEALTHSKVRLTWDDDDTTRKEVQKRAFSRAEMDENDMQAYIGSDSSDAESVASRKSAAEDRKAKKREAARTQMRGLLGLSDAAAKASKKSKDEPVGDMQITFTSGLGNGSKDGKGVFENEPQDKESTRERYIRKERERKQKRKEKMKTSRSGAEHEEPASPSAQEAVTKGGGDDAGFEDAFFTDPTAAADAEKKARKAERMKKRADKEAREAEAEARRTELELLMAEDRADNVRHFDMREIEKAEKQAKRKGKKGKKAKEPAEDADAADFAVEADDPRFKALFESHEYAIDPTNPRFKGTEGMKALLEEGRKKRKRTEGEPEADSQLSKKAAKKGGAGDDELNGLVSRLKGKSGRV